MLTLQVLLFLTILFLTIVVFDNFGSANFVFGNFDFLVFVILDNCCFLTLLFFDR